jgi:hypothetical protein
MSVIGFIGFVKEDGDRWGTVSNRSLPMNPGALDLSPLEQPNRNAFFGNPFMESQQSLNGPTAHVQT